MGYMQSCSKQQKTSLCHVSSSTYALKAPSQHHRAILYARSSCNLSSLRAELAKEDLSMLSKPMDATTKERVCRSVSRYSYLRAPAKSACYMQIPEKSSSCMAVILHLKEALVNETAPELETGATCSTRAVHHDQTEKQMSMKPMLTTRTLLYNQARVLKNLKTHLVHPVDEQPRPPTSQMLRRERVQRMPTRKVIQPRRPYSRPETMAHSEPSTHESLRSADFRKKIPEHKADIDMSTAFRISPGINVSSVMTDVYKSVVTERMECTPNHTAAWVLDSIDNAVVQDSAAVPYLQSSDLRPYFNSNADAIEQTEQGDEGEEESEEEEDDDDELVEMQSLVNQETITSLLGALMSATPPPAAAPRSPALPQQPAERPQTCSPSAIMMANGTGALGDEFRAPSRCSTPAA